MSSDGTTPANGRRVLTPEERERFRALLPPEREGDVYTEPPWDDMALPVSDLNIARDVYQRALDSALVARIVREYDPLLMHPIDVNMREDGSLWVCDGQHRTVATREKFGPMAMIECRVFYGLTEEQESLMFAANQFRKAPTPRENFRGCLRAGREPYVTVNALVNEAGWRLALDPQEEHEPGAAARITAVGSLLEVYKNYGGEHLVRTLSVFSNSFGRKHAPTAAMIVGTATFLNWYGQDAEFNEGHLLDKLRGVTYRGFSLMIDAERSGKHLVKRDAVSRVLVEIFNKGRKMPQRLVSWETALQRSKGKFRGYKPGDV